MNSGHNGLSHFVYTTRKHSSRSESDHDLSSDILAGVGRRNTAKKSVAHDNDGPINLEPFSSGGNSDIQYYIT